MRLPGWRGVVSFLLGYGLGSVPVAQAVAARRGVDLTAVGDRNPGGWNALEQLGGRDGALVFAGDWLKGALAGAAGLGLSRGCWWAGAAGVSGAMLGQMLPAQAPRKGGRGIMCFVGGVSVLTPAATALAAGLTGALRLAGRPAKQCALAGLVAQPFLIAALPGDPSRRRLATVVAWLIAIGVRSAAAEAASRRDAPAVLPTT